MLHRSKKLISKLLKPFDEELKAQSIELKESTILSSISTAKSKGLSASQLNSNALATDDQIALLISKIYQEYTDALIASNSLDFDDLLVYGVKLFETKPNLAHWCSHILVDEL